MSVSTAISLAALVVSIISLVFTAKEYSRLDKYRHKILDSQKCDLILIPTKEWDFGAKYQTLITELDDVGILKDWFVNGSLIFLSPFELNWFNSQRIYGVNIEPDKSVDKAKQFLIGTQYFRDVIVTKQGKNHE